MQFFAGHTQYFPYLIQYGEFNVFQLYTKVDKFYKSLLFQVSSLTEFTTFTIVIYFVGFTYGFPTVFQEKYDRAEELAGLFEGDIDLTPQQKNSIESLNGLQSVTTRWDNKIVAYSISNEFSKSDWDLSSILSLSELS